MKSVTVLGSTGSIGQNTLRVIDHLGDHFRVFALAANSAVGLLAEQTAAFHPTVVGIRDASRVNDFIARCREKQIPVPEVVSGDEGLCQISTADEIDIVVSAAVGAAGLQPTHAAVTRGKTVALANKEAMVLAGELLQASAQQHGARIIPIDSEHSALDQCLRSGKYEEVRRLILTASGGPFRDTPREQFSHIKPEQALKHPTWQMGRRITIDSATLMNKGLEVIEARWLFDLPAEKIDILIHPQSIVHSMVEFVDGSIVAQLSTTDMRQPIQYALTYPDRLPSSVSSLDWTGISRLDFDTPDREKFPAVGLAYRALSIGGTAPAVLNAADEVAVAAFLESRIPFPQIPTLIEAALDAHDGRPADSLESILAADSWARRFAADWVSRT